MLGYIDRKGLRDDAPSRSWNSSHPSRGPDGGCSQADLRSTGGDGLYYCFAAQLTVQAMPLASRMRAVGYSPLIKPASINSRLKRRASAPPAQR